MGDTREPPVRRRRTAGPRQRIRSRQEAIFLGALIAVTLAIAVVFLALGEKSQGIPAIGTAALLAISVATLFYAFLDGWGDSVAFQGVQLGGAAAVFVAVLLLVNSKLDPQLKAIVHAEEAERIAESRGTRLMLDTGMSPQPIAGGGTVSLKNVSASHGELWRIKEWAEPEKTLAALLDKAGVKKSAAELLRMSESQWKDWLKNLPKNRQLVEWLPFATLDIVSSDKRRERQTAFQRGEVPVLNKNGQPEAYLCIEHIFNVVEDGSRERETVLLVSRTSPCASAA